MPQVSWEVKTRNEFGSGAALKAAKARSASHFSRTGAGPVGLVMIAFGVDPMTGRASAHAAGHGFIAGWAIAIAGDMLYFAVIAVTTLRLNTYIRDPDNTMLIILAAMFGVPALVRFVRNRQVRQRRQSSSRNIEEMQGDALKSLNN